MLVPMIATSVPGRVTVAAGTETWASTLATATAVPARQPVQPAASFAQAAGRSPIGTIVPRHLVVDDRSEAGFERLEERAVREPVGSADQMRLVAGRAVVPRLDCR